MSAQVFVPLVLTVVLAVYVGIAIATWRRYHGRRVVVCPQTKRPADVTLDLGHAMATAVWDRADLRVATCSDWPDRRGCSEACIAQITPER